MDDWKWAKERRLEFSAMLRSKIHQLRQAEVMGPPDPRAELVKAARAAGLDGERIGELLRELDATPP